jgi:hypothetical protein
MTAPFLQPSASLKIVPTQLGDQKSLGANTPGLNNAAQTICKPTRGEMVNARHRPDGLDDSLSRPERQKRGPKPWVRGA